jgi:hypothetical protein
MTGLTIAPRQQNQRQEIRAAEKSAALEGERQKIWLLAIAKREKLPSVGNDGAKIGRSITREIAKFSKKSNMSPIFLKFDYPKFWNQGIHR